MIFNKQKETNDAKVNLKSFLERLQMERPRMNNGVVPGIGILQCGEKQNLKRDISHEDELFPFRHFRI